MPGSLSRGEDGSLLRNKGGQLIHACQGTCDECFYCGAVQGDDLSWTCYAHYPGCPTYTCCTPNTYLCTFSGLTACSGCIVCETSGSINNVVLPAGINATHTLKQAGGCTWYRLNRDLPDDGHSGSYDRYTSADCTTGQQGKTEEINIEFYRYATTFRLAISFCCGDINQRGKYFDATFSATTQRCDESFSGISNTLSCKCITTSSTTPRHLCSTGTATLIPCG